MIHRYIIGIFTDNAMEQSCPKRKNLLVRSDGASIFATLHRDTRMHPSANSMRFILDNIIPRNKKSDPFEEYGRKPDGLHAKEAPDLQGQTERAANPIRRQREDDTVPLHKIEQENECDVRRPIFKQSIAVEGHQSRVIHDDELRGHVGALFHSLHHVFFVRRGNYPGFVRKIEIFHSQSAVGFGICQ